MKIPTGIYHESMELKMTPMIDVVFLLLVFFVWTSSFELPEFDLPSSIAQPPAGGSEVQNATAPAEAFDEIVIRLSIQDAALVIDFGGESMGSVEGLRERLTQILALGVQPPVIIDPANNVTMNDAVRVYDAARDAGADRVLFAADPAS
ncbi:biopolymer transporter ExbD [Rubripirellula reticaptiva]|uniref:Biopolymer transport protein ExbD/TolR n=1 Tax=Rubripirellula reticaptiva TaxID=2528013 RepID=A0A5C6FD98_9BACT|nr:biopolymer transporter ExbD [Rubripirellula reticaptiva]TWU58046.1 Biopolymer transport protein ExbD/TolR [Rubripirellula reticaptiva]